MKKTIFILNTLLLTCVSSMSAQGLGDFFSDGTNGYRILLAEDGTPTTEVRLIGHISEGTFDWSYYGFEYVPDEVEHEGKTYQVVEFGPFSRHETSLSQLRFGKNMRKIDISKQDFGLERGFEVAEENQHYKTIDNILYSKDGKTLVMCSSGFNPYRTTITIPDGVETIGKEGLAWCGYIKIDELPKTLKTIGRRAFYYFSNVPKDFVLPEGIKTIEPEAFYSTPIQRLTLPSTLEVLGDIMGMWRLKTLVCLAPTPPATTGTTSDGVEFHWFESWDSYCQNVVLMVPKGSKELYQQDPVWGLFKRIMEVGEEICAPPTISYENGKLKFSSSTEGAQFISSITCDDCGDYTESDISLAAAYNISVYAEAKGYIDSDVVTATLCWLDANPTIETRIVNELHARPLLMQASEGVLSVAGLEEGETIQVFSTDGRQLASVKAIGSTLTIPVTSPSGQTLIVKIAGKAVKVMMR